MHNHRAQIQKAIGKIEERGLVPEIDFTQHQLENGYTISTQERVVKDVRSFSVSGGHLVIVILQVQAPAMTLPTDDQFFSREDSTKPDIVFLKNHFYREGRLTEEHALYIIEKATELLSMEPNLVQVDAPVTGETEQSCCTIIPHYFFLVCGDIHGQYVRSI
jgi:serine/threonine-protein phosphatase 2B catalytic subunit